MSMESGEEQLGRWLNRQVRVEVSDQRKFYGRFLCTDHEGTAILSDTTEDSNGLTRALGLVVIPGKHIKSFSIRL
ncbi:Sm domain-containing protein [Schizosaccharomyces cryophilus OY26]|uniref:Sm domain-containing protein n=1 Tax=Schizosaccharomyces cryophilus (strain OY26 / ATCC MYA-4695 / CBS 11777 / NBRC 106824 / NRRL Y48691) TaxID=653667 RepID=S9VTP4_SCHCR|nr:Sm domain-containing protein [Schizosaccharomyces cryophilus OY26]EPY51248.1 Sm domain-containing protein [Schizosaccharomyces cryophilus OY26]